LRVAEVLLDLLAVTDALGLLLPLRVAVGLWDTEGEVEEVLVGLGVVNGLQVPVTDWD
jgi:uncharacterized protein (DUF302 family)